MPITRNALTEHFHPDLCLLVIAYLQWDNRENWAHIAFIGEYETCLSCPQKNVNGVMYGACYAGNLPLAELMIQRGATNFNLGLNGACFAGHLALAKLMIQKGAKGTLDFHVGLNWAKRS